MTNTGYPTPDNPVGEMGYICKPIFIPNDSQFIAMLYGQLREAANDWYWKQTGTMTPEDAAKYMANALGMNDLLEECGASMSCEDMVDCIETNAETQAALMDYLNANGFTSGNNPQIPVDQLSPSQKAENLLPAGYDCNNDQMMATARLIVTSLNDGIEQFFQQIELYTNPVEGYDNIIDNLPGMETVGVLSSLFTTIQDALGEAYIAAYSQTAEDEISCAIYCAMQAECLISFDALSTTLVGLMDTISPPDNPADYAEVAQWLVDLTGAGTALVAAMMWFAVNSWRFGEGFFGLLSDMRSLSAVLQASMGQSDQTWVNCDECEDPPTPDTYWKWLWDFSRGQQGWVALGGWGQWDGSGWRGQNQSNNTWYQIWKDFGATYQIKAVAAVDQRRGSIGSGTADGRSIRTSNNVPFTGSQTVIASVSGITDNDNESYNGVLLPGNVAARSAVILGNTEGVPDYPTNFNKIWRVVYYGLPNAGNVKPEGSIWVNSIPSNPADMLGL